MGLSLSVSLYQKTAFLAMGITFSFRSVNSTYLIWNQLLHRYHLMLLFLFSILYIRHYCRRFRAVIARNWKTICCQFHNRFQTQTVAYVIHRYTQPTTSLSFPECPQPIQTASRYSYACAADDVSDADSICSCDSSHAIGPRPSFLI